jgi:hypothetical protein
MNLDPNLLINYFKWKFNQNQIQMNWWYKSKFKKIDIKK